MSDLNPIERVILRKEVMNLLKKYWPTISAALGGVITFALPSVTAYIAAHPKSAVGVLLSCIVAAYHSTAPKDSVAVQGK
jgi:hypothetical protein